jgi:hypothetical protein
MSGISPPKRLGVRLAYVVSEKARHLRMLNAHSSLQCAVPFVLFTMSMEGETRQTQMLDHYEP